MINFFLLNGGYGISRGNSVWRRMAEESVCPGRSILSMKSHFNKIVSKRLGDFGVTEEELLWKNSGQLTEKKGKKWAPYYTKEEDEAMVNFLLQNGGYECRWSSTVWMMIEEAGICPNRSWQSLRKRFNNVVRKKLEDFGVTEKDLLLHTLNHNESAKLVVEVPCVPSWSKDHEDMNPNEY